MNSVIVSSSEDSFKLLAESNATPLTGSKRQRGGKPSAPLCLSAVEGGDCVDAGLERGTAANSVTMAEAAATPHNPPAAKRSKPETEDRIACGGAGASSWPAQISTASVGFLEMRSRGLLLVDKTAAIADLLCSYMTQRAIFSRPRRFGKSLTLDIMAQLLRAGRLPDAVTPWADYTPVDDHLFEGLAVHARLKGADPRDKVLYTAHFVIELSLIEAQTGSQLSAVVISQLKGIASASFGAEAAAAVGGAGSPCTALRLLLQYVPPRVPVAVLVDEYDHAIVADVGKRQWAAAAAGAEALRSLLSTSKLPCAVNKVTQFVVTGIARFASCSLSSGANNFEDITAHPLLSRAIGFTREDIIATYSGHLARMRLDDSIAESTLAQIGGNAASNQETALNALTWWYDGYCFDGVSSCFNPQGVLQALRRGTLCGGEMEGATSSYWLGSNPASVMQGLWERDSSQQQVPVASTTALNVADLEAGTVNAQAMLLQIGLLTLYPATPSSAGGASAAAGEKPAPVMLCQVPNEYARASLRAMASRAMPTANVSYHMAAVQAALRDADAGRFERAVQTVLQGLPSHMLKAGSVPRVGDGESCSAGIVSAGAATSVIGSASDGAAAPSSAGDAAFSSAGSAGCAAAASSSAALRQRLREAPLHAALWACLHFGIPVQLALTIAEANVKTGGTDLVIIFTQRPLVWIVEVGTINDGRSVEGEAKRKVSQATRYATAYAAERVEVVCCSLLVSTAVSAAAGAVASPATAQPLYAVNMQWRVVQAAPGKQLTRLPEAPRRSSSAGASLPAGSSSDAAAAVAAPTLCP